MYVVSFRIPFRVMGTTQYVNGSLLSPVVYRPGARIKVQNNELSLAAGQVILSQLTRRKADSFKWSIVNEL